MSTVQTAIDKVSQDIRLQLASTTGSAGQPILIDYTNRIQKQMLRFSRWAFTKSEPQYFITRKGQTDYWIGPTGTQTAGMVDTGLNLSDVDRIQQDSVRDLSNNRNLQFVDSSPIGPGLIYRSGQSRQGLPAVAWQDHNDVNILHLYPGADNVNTFQPTPSTPVLFSAAGGALALRTYFVRTTFVDSSGGESVGSPITSSLTIAASRLIHVGTPILPFATTDTGVTYSSYNVYASTSEGTETLQTVSPIALGTNWTEPTSGLISGVSVPTANTLAQFGGYVMQFRYFKARTVLSAVGNTLQIPDDYLDVMVHGISALAWKFLGDTKQAAASQEFYRQGLSEIIGDINQGNGVDFVHPDPATFVNSQLLDW